MPDRHLGFIISATVLVAACAPAAIPEPALEASASTTQQGAAPDAVAMVAVEGEGARYWPRWRGPSGQGIVAGAGYPDRWSATDNVVWRTTVEGRGNSSPIVWEDRIFLTAGRNRGRELYILAYDRTDGSLLWETDVAPGSPERVHQKNGPASATPATDGERVYVSLGSRGLVALDLDGNRIWHTEVGRIDNYHGPAGSPLLHGDRVFIYQDQQPAGFVAAYDTATGEQVWRTAREATVGWGTPVLIRAGDREELIVSSSRTVNSYDPDTGAELWRCEGNNFEVIPTPVVEAGLVFCTSGRAGPTLAIRPGGSGNVTGTHLAWTTARGSPFVPSPLAYDGRLYTINDMASIVTAFRAATGEVLWQGRLGRAVREGFSASPIYVDGKVFFTNDDGITFVLRAGDEFDLLHTNDIGARTLATPALVDGYWYIRTEDELLAIGN
ncbi:MAG: PQQ-binding-like beta-propeller repeat protein [Acidobacteria bacterium]|nr:PQQ-binding-like beta-propeller repeat protein [Acidobacteriota bacterium]MYD70640.1 PQQ-binding-like beta-propeller repeat protein [Acidobacteriota bacterium]MYJ03262.1 PQQ-binding-like beta-propeller repeat protein [Acidobacteriota bacterium]